MRLARREAKSPKELKERFYEWGANLDTSEFQSPARTISAMFRMGFLTLCLDAMEMGLFYHIVSQLERMLGLRFRSLLFAMEHEDQASNFFVRYPHRDRVKNFARAVIDFAVMDFGVLNGIWDRVTFVPAFGFWAVLATKFTQIHHETQMGLGFSSPLEKAFWKGFASCMIGGPHEHVTPPKDKAKLMFFLEDFPNDILDHAVDAMAELFYEHITKGHHVEMGERKLRWLTSASRLLQPLVEEEDEELREVFDVFCCSLRDIPVLIF
ncbi:MAG: hypothetical protein QXO86_06670 [Nitrososphaerota archaeon]